MGSGPVVTAIIEWATAALRDHPLLVAPTLVIALGVVGLAVIEAATLTVQVCTAMVHHYRHRLSELTEALRELRTSVLPKKNGPTRVRDLDSMEGARTHTVQRNLLAQQRLFDRSRSANASKSDSG